MKENTTDDKFQLIDASLVEYNLIVISDTTGCIMGELQLARKERMWLAKDGTLATAVSEIFFGIL